ncbi:Glyoxalase/bleomycin resistance protein/dioxygenase [Pseudorhizobium banfieldiae]|uniref:Glyoxalase/bleomycin resistance protein/dioxygenase n=1 Tax=Pseudorhizobium banfieldiae TaxID=1125847 RepID=L0NBK9_9HYPH|nr:VOC family protein [Pseudorhizobium banfieldiae]CAD6602645.1 VOC family protein [arsenite-oxidising bacterium NT-25]CAD6607579.1 VOC family protein [Rhizobium sp. TCK]CCF18503.1 Glyoxalase/bleomycin resistance protein/dioxygenase [Pseudorhizobium banfieldiae]
MLQTASETRSETHGKFIWCELMTSDTEAAGRFYSSVLGWSLNAMPMGEGDAYYLFQIGEGDKCPGIGGMMKIPTEMAGSMPPNWSGYVAVDDVDRTAREFAENGGTVHRQPEDIPQVGRFAVVADPHGAVLNIMTPLPMDDMPPPPPEGAPGTVGWHELYAADLEEAFEFYSRIFGWTKDSDFDMGEMGAYRLFAEHGKQTGGMMKRPEEIPMPCWVYYFNVESVEAAIGRVRAGGGQVLNGPMEVPGGSWIAQCTDPQGAFFCLASMQK